MDVLGLARRDPDALVTGGPAVTIDEVQREPDLLSAVKREIDRQRRPGRFLLTGSANLLLMRRVSESLAGRASYLTLWPMTRREQSGVGQCGAWERLLKTPDADWLDVVAEQPGDPEDWEALARRGGSRFRPSISTLPRRGRSGSMVTCRPTLSGTCRPFPRSQLFPTSGD